MPSDFYSNGYNYNIDSGSVGAFAGLSFVFVMIYCVVLLAILVVTGFIYYRLAKKMGYNPWFGLLMFVPIANIVIPFILIFSKWPIEEELERLRGHKKAEVSEEK